MSELTIAPSSIQTGDLLAWSHDPNSAKGDFITRMVGWLTGSRYGHVGIAWRCHDGIDEELFVIEATIPLIRTARVTSDRNFYCIPMNINWTARNKAFLMSKIGLKYGYMDALRSYFGMTLENDDRYQCAELAHGFYKESNIDLPEDLIPGNLVRNAEKKSGNQVHRVVNPVLSL